MTSKILFAAALAAGCLLGGCAGMLGAANSLLPGTSSPAAALSTVITPGTSPAVAPSSATPLAAVTPDQIQHWQDQITYWRGAITLAETGWTAFCATSTIKSCSDPTTKREIAALETDLSDGLQALYDGLDAYKTNGTTAAMDVAIDKISTVLADFNATQAAFKVDKAAPPRHPLSS